jgi:hypothetical protein
MHGLQHSERKPTGLTSSDLHVRRTVLLVTEGVRADEHHRALNHQLGRPRAPLKHTESDRLPSWPTKIRVSLSLPASS